ncbi:hypothetical protein RCL_jg6606.t1 [Rhizophagus clarus]|uniref:Uncharacterized protein n=1 Tax=Rhizophagus clarus TaxID=94130 RepID=A0A8H3LGV9_9GLOM|nr:hypothetical protein RCL_jg6606.t1 [Rhizophagus clarus]
MKDKRNSEIKTSECFFQNRVYKRRFGRKIRNLNRHLCVLNHPVTSQLARLPRQNTTGLFQDQFFNGTNSFYYPVASQLAQLPRQNTTDSFQNQFFYGTNSFH